MGGRIKAARAGRYSQEDLADELGVHQNTLRNYELDRRKPPTDLLERIAELTGVSIEWLVKGRATGEADRIAAELAPYAAARYARLGQDTHRGQVRTLRDAGAQLTEILGERVDMLSGRDTAYLLDLMVKYEMDSTDLVWIADAIIKGGKAA